jgi:hypothetical protein
MAEKQGQVGVEKPSDNAAVDRSAIIDEVGRKIQPHTKDIKLLDPDAQVGYRGSLARGFKGEHKGYVPFDPNNFDVDAFIVSDILAARFPKGTPFRAGTTITEVARIQRLIDSSLRQSPTLSGLRKDPFTFRVYTHAEISDLMRFKGDRQIYFIP